MPIFVTNRHSDFCHKSDMPIVSNSRHKIGNKKPQIGHKSPQIGSADFYLFDVCKDLVLEPGPQIFRSEFRTDENLVLKSPSQ